MGVATAIIAASAVQAVGSIEEGKAADRQARQQAAIAEQQAQQEKEITEAEIKDFTKNQSRLLAERRAALGASGVDLSSGSPVLSTEDFAAEVALQTQRIRKGGEIRATRLQQQASLLRESGRNARRAGAFRAGSSLLSGFASSSQFNS